MATKIRLKRIGRRNRPFYRMVAMDSRNRRDGAAIEELGWYNPIDSNHSYDLKDERILHWLGEGAQPTDAAKKLLRRAGLSHRWHLMQQGMDGSDLEKEMKKWELNREDVLKKRAEKQEQKAKVVAKKNKVEAAEAVKSDSGDASTNDEGLNEDQLGEDIPEQPEGNDIDESSQEEE
ncbi:MAG: 30S ribosomal protein S16 [Candidatus Neomarinimicrobiota bacterium]